MSHHGFDPFDGDDPAFARRQKLMRSLLNETASFRGALGQFPQGQLTPQDEGAIQFAVGGEKGKVVLDFGTPVTWMAMSPQEAADLASSLMKWARIEGRKVGETITLNLSAP